jgi:CPA2 family monovalent cation:H+ antiporter-2
MFFVSVGMLVKPEDVIGHWDRVLMAIVLIVVLKGVVSGALAVLLRCSGRTALVLAAGRGQVGEFSFILGQSALSLGLLTEPQYSLILAGAIGSITVNPLVIRLVDPAERWLKRHPQLWRLIDRPRVADLATPAPAADHVVIVGCGRVGRHIAEALAKLGVPRIVIEGDPERVDRLQELGVPVVYGDASSSEILDTVGLDRARALVVTLPDDSSALAVVTTARLRAPKLDVIARAATWDGARRLVAAGASHVVRPELEGGVEIVRRTLLELNLPVREVQRYSELVRREGLGETERQTAEQARMLEDLVTASRQLEVGWVEVADGSAIVGRALAESGLRERAGVTVVAISRHGSIVSNPAALEVLRAGDRLAVIGTPGQIADTETLVKG